MLKHRLTKSFIANHLSGIAVVGSLLARPGDAAVAGARFFHASTCAVASGVGTLNGSGQYDNAGVQPLELWCPLNGDPAGGLRATSPSVVISALGNGGANGNPPIQAAICAVFAGGGGQSCPSLFSFGTARPGVTQIAVPFPAISPGDYAYLKVVLGIPARGRHNTLIGYKLTNN